MKAYSKQLESVTSARGKKVVSADTVMLVALETLSLEHRTGVSPQYKEHYSVEELLLDVDQKIYDYVIAEIGKIREKLQEKVETAREKRDWHPAAKFMEPEELLGKLFGSVSYQIKGKLLELVIPHFFGRNNADTEDGGLVLSIGYADGIYYVHDNGTAIGQLKKNVASRWEEVLDKICDREWIWEEQINGTFCQMYSFFYYLQRLILIANGDLFWEHLSVEDLYEDNVEKKIYAFDRIENGFLLSEFDRLDDFNVEVFISELKSNFAAFYDQNKGLILGIHMCYSGNSTTVSYQMKTLEQRSSEVCERTIIQISDNAKGKIEGEILENFYWNYDDITLYQDFITPYLQRFGGKFEGKDICITDEVEDKNFLPVLYRFINLGVLLSELNHGIELP